MKTMDIVKEYLASEGYRYEVDSDGDIVFKYQGLTLYFPNNESDPYFFRIIMPNIYTVEGNREKVLEAVNAVSRDMKVIKAYLVEDRLWLSIEMYIDSTPELNDFVPRCLNILYDGYRRAAELIFG